MTIIAAMRETEESILIACDSETLEGNALKVPRIVKLKSHRTAPLSWGMAGNRAIADDFGDWLSIYDWPPADWPSFSKEVAWYLCELNGEQRERTKRAGLEPTDSDIACCLLVGWLGEPQIYEFDERGRITSYSSTGFHAIGQGKVHAYVAHRTLLNHINPEPEKTRQLHIIMQVVTSIAPHCGRPYYIWRVSRGGIVDITHDVEAKNAEEAR